MRNGHEEAPATCLVTESAAPCHGGQRSCCAQWHSRCPRYIIIVPTSRKCDSLAKVCHSVYRTAYQRSASSDRPSSRETNTFLLFLAAPRRVYLDNMLGVYAVAREVRYRPFDAAFCAGNMGRKSTGNQRLKKRRKSHHVHVIQGTRHRNKKVPQGRIHVRHGFHHNSSLSRLTLIYSVLGD